MDIYQSFSTQIAATAMVTLQSLLALGADPESVSTIINFTADMCKAGRIAGTVPPIAAAAAPPAAAIALRVSPTRDAQPLGADEHVGRGASPSQSSRSGKRPDGRTERGASQPQPRTRTEVPAGPAGLAAGRVRHHQDRVFSLEEDEKHRALEGRRYTHAEIAAHKARQRAQSLRDLQRNAADERKRPRGPSSKRSKDTDRDPEHERDARSRRGRNN